MGDSNSNSDDPRSAAGKFAAKLLVGVVDSLARGLAKGAESIVGDAKKALKNEALKLEQIEKGVETWRKVRLGEVDDLPDSLKDDAGAQNGKGAG